MLFKLLAVAAVIWSTSTVEPAIHSENLPNETAKDHETDSSLTGDPEQLQDELAALPTKPPFQKRFNKFRYVDLNGKEGWFVRLDGANWVNRDGSGNNYSFLEVPGTPTPGYVWFFDSNRNMTFRIASDGTTAWSTGGAWNAYVTGQWVE